LAFGHWLFASGFWLKCHFPLLWLLFQPFIDKYAGGYSPGAGNFGERLCEDRKMIEMWITNSYFMGSVLRF